ncbi:MAG: leucyl aminopeptidase [Candidatus Cloacimonetes bacterium]|nr:leucyl aminopeptidase [Candidatus Cloacimonadota bacterium]
MKISITRADRRPKRFDTRIISLYQDQKEYDLDNKTIQILKKLKQKRLFSGKQNEITVIAASETELGQNIIFSGLGTIRHINSLQVRRTVSISIRKAKEFKSRIALYEPILPSAKIPQQEMIQLTAETAQLTDYSFEKYITSREDSTLRHLHIMFPGRRKKSYTDAFTAGSLLAEATIQARELVNEPANILNPVELGKRVLTLAEKYGFTVEIFDEDQISQLGMTAFLEVARGSDNPPRFIVMKYRGNPADPKQIIGFVGKGLTFDSGGYSLKQTPNMLTMKGDMGGAAAVIGAMVALAGMKLPINATAAVAACENMLSGKSYRPSDIISSRGGKTIYIANTDAEGRLTLIDAVHYLIEKEKVTRIVDIATLTGAAVVCLGHEATAVISNNDRFYRKLILAAEKSGEKIWRLPAFEEYNELLKSKFADLTNSPGNPGTITAGLFIGQFVANLPWLHLDIAGTFWAEKDKYYFSRGGTGVGTRLLYHLAASLVKSPEEQL